MVHFSQLDISNQNDCQWLNGNILDNHFERYGYQLAIVENMDSVHFPDKSICGKTCFA